MESPKVAIINVINQDNKILVVRRSTLSDRSGEWESPAGHVEKGESSTAAALREVLEETNLDVLLYPKTILIDLREGGKGIIFLARLPGDSEDAELELNPEEHDKYHWISLGNIDKVKPSPPNFAENIKKILQLNGVRVLEKTKMKTSSTRRAHFPSRSVRVMPGPNADLKEAILVGDEVDIFLKSKTGPKKKAEPDIHGIVERRNKNVLWIRDQESPFATAIPVEWNDNSTWAFVRVIRGKDDVINYVPGNPFDPDSDTIQQARGLGLILDPPKPKHTESVLRIMRGETPDLDMSLGQAPKSLEVVAPTSKTKNPVYHQVIEALEDHDLEPDMVDDIGNGRVMILTQDSELKSEIRRVLKKTGNEVEQTRTGALVIQARKRRAFSNNGVQPVQGPGTQGAGMQQMQPKFQMVMPDPQEAINKLEKASGSPVQKTPDGMTVTFDDPAKAQQFMSQPVARRGQQRRTEVGRLAARVKSSLRVGNLREAADCLSSLRNLGVKEASIRQASLATRNQWQQLHSYLDGRGDISTARVAQKLAITASDV